MTHYLVESDDEPRFSCACGAVFDAPSIEKANDRFKAHHGVEMARAALRGEERE